MSGKKGLDEFLPSLTSRLDELVKETAQAIANDNRVYMNPKEMDIQLAASNAVFRLLDTKQTILYATEKKK